MNKISALIFTVLLSSYTNQPYAQIDAPFDGVKLDNIEPFEDKSIFRSIENSHNFNHIKSID